MVLDSDPIALLRRSRKLSTDADLADFASALEQLALRMDPADVPDLYRSFDDATEDYNLFWAVLHLIERYDSDAKDSLAGARTFLEILPEMLPTAQRWMTILAIRQLNHEDARPLLIQAGRSAPSASRTALEGVLIEIASEHESPVADELASRAVQALAALRQPAD